MFGDILLPPTGCLDWYMIGSPACGIVFLSVAASLIALFFVLARQRQRARNIKLLAVCAFLFIAIDLVVYAIGYNFPQLSRRQPPRPPRTFEVEQKPESPSQSQE